MNNSYGKKIYDILNENKLSSLSILLEEDEDKKDDKKDDESNDKTDDMFSALDDEPEASEADSDEPDSDEPDSDEPDSDEPEASEADEGLTDAVLAQNAKDMESIASKLFSVANELDAVEGVMANAYMTAAGASKEETLGSISDGKIYSNFTLKEFLNEDDKNIKKLTSAMEDLDTAIAKSTDIITKFKKGVDINMEKYVSSAINTYKNFDNLFSKHDIVKQGAINVLILNSGSKSDEHIREFEELFHKELYSQFGIEDKKFIEPVNKTYTAAGASKQS
ncbi:MAG: hypothetical protein HOK65_11400 [Crocinitomicaceae bacterium]|jgi:hypothetical protein|nr:hypothetical protein [Crocinitomicaceae bacterium]